MKRNIFVWLSPQFHNISRYYLVSLLLVSYLCSLFFNNQKQPNEPPFRTLDLFFVILVYFIFIFIFIFLLAFIYFLKCSYLVFNNKKQPNKPPFRTLDLFFVILVSFSFNFIFIFLLAFILSLFDLIFQGFTVTPWEIDPRVN